MSRTPQQVIERYLELVNAHEFRRLVEVVAPDVVVHGMQRRDLEGFDAFVRALEAMTIAFADLRSEVDDVVAAGDRVAVRLTTSLRHVGEFQGVAPTGKVVTLGETNIYRVTDGRVVESWMRGDMLGLLGQLGALG